MIVDTPHHLALGRTGVDHYLSLGIRRLETVQNLRQHLHRSTDRHGYDDNVAPVDTVFKGDHLVA